MTRNTALQRLLRPLASLARLWLSIIVLAFGPALCSAQTAVLWKEGFESDDFWERWHSEGGVWSVGSPTKGPEKAFAGARCAGTLLEGDYPPGIDTRLVRDRVFIVPPEAQNPRLRLWHWFRGGPGAARALEIVSGPGPWQPLLAVSGWTSDDWTRATFDLRPFSGQAVQIAFHFQSSRDTNVAAGWFIDDVTLETGEASALINSPESFEAGLGDWKIDNGTWELGVPKGPPGNAVAGRTVWEPSSTATISLRRIHGSSALCSKPRPPGKTCVCASGTGSRLSGRIWPKSKSRLTAGGGRRFRCPTPAAAPFGHARLSTCGRLPDRMSKLHFTSDPIPAPMSDGVGTSTTWSSRRVQTPGTRPASQRALRAAWASGPSTTGWVESGRADAWTGSGLGWPILCRHRIGPALRPQRRLALRNPALHRGANRSHAPFELPPVVRHRIRRRRFHRNSRTGRPMASHRSGRERFERWMDSRGV